MGVGRQWGLGQEGLRGRWGVKWKAAANRVMSRAIVSELQQLGWTGLRVDRFEHLTSELQQLG